jgi:hypothetical protein
MAINHAFCHLTTFRRRQGDPLEFALAGISDVLGYPRFLINCTRDPRLTARGTAAGLKLTVFLMSGIRQWSSRFFTLRSATRLRRATPRNVSHVSLLEWRRRP